MNLVELSKLSNEEYEAYLRELDLPISHLRTSNFLKVAFLLDKALLLSTSDSFLLNQDDLINTLYEEDDDITTALTKTKLQRESKKAKHKKLNTILYVSDSMVNTVSTIESRLVNIKVVYSSPQVGSDDDEVFYVSDAKNDLLEKEIKMYGNYCTIIGYRTYIAGNDIDEGDRDSSENFTITVYSLNQLVEYLTKDYDITDKKYKYTIPGFSGLVKYRLHYLLRGWTYVYGKQPFVDLLYFDAKGPKRDKSLENMKTGMKTVVDVESISNVSDKRNLFFTMKNLYPQTYSDFIAETRDLNEVPTYDDWMRETNINLPVIFRPYGPGAYSGKGVYFADTPDSYNEISLKVSGGKEMWNPYIVSQAIEPYLFNERKFHLRVTVLITSWGKILMYPRAHVFTAKLPYVKGDYSNPLIHKSKHGHTLFDAYYPEAFPETEQHEMKKGLDVIFKALKKAMRAEVRSYSESTFAIETIDLDIMFDTSLKAYLIEVNTKIGFGPIKTVYDVDNYHEADLLVQWIFDNGIKKYIEYKQEIDPIKIDNVLDLEVRDRMLFIDILTQISPWKKEKFKQWYFDNIRSNSTVTITIYRIIISNKTVAIAIFEPLPSEISKKEGIYLNLYFISGLSIESKANILKHTEKIHNKRIYSLVRREEQDLLVFIEAGWYKLSQTDDKSVFSNKFS